LIAAVVVFAAGIVLAVAQPGDLGGKDSTNRAASSTTKPSSTGSTTGTTGTSAPSTTVAAQATSSSPGAPTTATTKPAGSATTTTVTPGGLGQSGAGGGTGTHPITGGTSLLALGLLMIAAALALRRSVTATA
jgi:hypothetical protein